MGGVKKRGGRQAGKGRERDRGGERYPSAELGLAAGGEAGSKVSSAAGSPPRPPPAAPVPRGAALRQARTAGCIVCSLARAGARSTFFFPRSALCMRELAPFVSWRVSGRKGWDHEPGTCQSPGCSRVSDPGRGWGNRGPLGVGGVREQLVGREAAAFPPRTGCRIASCVAVVVIVKGALQI